MTGLVAGISAKIAGSLILGRAKAVATKGVGILASIPKPVWEAFAVIGYIVALFALHQHYANAAIKAADAAGYERRAAEDAAVLLELQNRARTAETNLAQIAQDERTKNETAARARDAHADSLLSRGPGAARCGLVGNPPLPAAPGGQEPSARPVDVGLGGVPGQERPDLIAVPFPEFIARSRQCDADAAEALSWRSADDRNRVEWAKLKGVK